MGSNRHRMLSALAAAGILAGALPAVGSSFSAASGEPVVCEAPSAEPTFEMAYIDETRAGGEPLVVTHSDGNLLWGSHAGTTHFYSPAAPDPRTAAFLENYEGQTYQYYSEDGVDWAFSPRTPIRGEVGSGVPNSGFSDPEFAIDKAGNVFISEINLANIAFSKSSDGGKSYELQNVIGISLSDRQWMEADEEDVLWFVANTFGGGSPTAGEPVTGSLANRLYKSTDGGQTFSAGQTLEGGRQRSSEIQVDKSDGRLYQLDTRAGSTLKMSVFPEARNETPPNVQEVQHDVTTGYSAVSSIGPTFDIDGEGNLYVVWDQRGSAGRPQGIYYAYSTDRGESWSEPQKVNTGDNLAFWPWIAVGQAGGVSITWLENDAYKGNDPESVPAGSGWDVKVALTDSGLGCEDSKLAGFVEATASSEPVHRGTICNGGTVCQAQAVDRRLGDYFSNAVDAEGNTVIAVSDTRQGGAVALPLVIRQIGGPTVGDGREPLRN